MTILPTVKTPFYKVTVTLTGTEYVLDYQYNQREDRWYLSLYDTNGNAIYTGRKIVLSVPLFRKCATGNKPLGDIFAQSLTADDTPPKLDDIGTDSRAVLVYYEPGELAA